MNNANRIRIGNLRSKLCELVDSGLTLDEISDKYAVEVRQGVFEQRSPSFYVKKLSEMGYSFIAIKKRE